MAGFYQQFNDVYLEFVKGFVASFGSEMKTLALEYQLVKGFLEKHGPETQKIFERIKTNVATIYTQIHKRDASIFEKPCDPEKCVALLERTQLYEIWPHLVPNERDLLWKGLGIVIQHTSLLSGTGNRLEKFTALASTFLDQNPDVTQKDLQKKVYQQLFTDKNMAAQMKDLMCEGNLNGLRTGFGEMMQGLNVGGIPSESDNQSRALSSKTSRKMYLEEEEDKSAATVEDDDVSALFREMSGKADALNEAETKLDNRPPMEELLDFMQKQPIDAEAEAEVGNLARTMLGDESTPESRESMSRLFSVLTSEKRTPEQSALLVSELRKNFGATDADLEKLREMSSELGGAFGPGQGGFDFSSILNIHV